MQDLNCNQVSALLTFFVENKLSQKLMQSVEYHINMCRNCRDKYIKIQDMYRKYINLQNEADISGINSDYDKPYYSNMNKEFMENISAYTDNELNETENLRIRKFAILNPEARKELENLILFRKLLNDIITESKNNLILDYSENTINSLFNNFTDKNEENYNPYLILISGLFCTIIITITAIYFLH